MKPDQISAVLRHLVDELIVVQDAAGATLYVTPSVEHVLGYPELEFLGLDMTELFHAEDREHAAGMLAQVREEPGACTRARLRLRHRNSRHLWCELVATNLLDDTAGGVVVSIRNISEQRALEQRLEQMTIRDKLTGLLNRRGFMQILDTTLEDAKTHNAGVLLIDLTGFKPILESLGQAAGDEALQRCGQLIREALRPGDVAAHLDYDGFAVLCHRVIDRKVLKMIAERIRKSAGGGYELEAGSAWLGLTVGAVLTQSDDNARGVMALADRALQAATEAGEDRVAIAKR